MKPSNLVPSIVVLLSCVSMALGQAAAPPPPPPTLFNFFGIPQGFQKVRDNRANRNGNNPQRERVPKPKRIADPANLESKNPAIKKAAEVKTEEDLAPQKIKAIKYLASIGCGCYNKDGGITAALLAAMDDCTEEVRLAAVEAISDAAACDHCRVCNQQGCCTPAIAKKLEQMAYEQDDKGCWLEPSARVRAAAARALNVCSQDRLPTTPGVRPEMPTPEAPTPEVPAPPAPAPDAARRPMMYRPATHDTTQFERVPTMGHAVSNAAPQPEVATRPMPPITKTVASRPVGKAKADSAASSEPVRKSVLVSSTSRTKESRVTAESAQPTDQPGLVRFRTTGDAGSAAVDARPMPTAEPVRTTSTAPENQATVVRYLDNDGEEASAARPADQRRY